MALQKTKELQNGVQALIEIRNLVRNSGKTNVIRKADIEEIIKDINFKEMEDEE